MSASLDLLVLGNAIVDVIARTEDAFLSTQGVTKGAMQLIDEERAEALFQAMGPATIVSGGSGANTAVGAALLGTKTGFVGKVRDDELGTLFGHDLKATGVGFTVPAAAEGPATARCLILVTPDAQRTMNTFLGAAQQLERHSVDDAAIADAAILYLEGYLWDPQAPRSAMEAAISAARAAGRKVAFTLSDTFCVDRHKADFWRLVDERRIDILFANEAELAAMTGESEFEAGLGALASKVPMLVVTRSEQGAVAVAGAERASVPAEPIRQLVDTTGAGDLFAAGFLAGQARDLGLEESLKLGAIAAAEVIQHYGARPEQDLKVLAADLL